MISITFPDKTIKRFDTPITGAELAKTISDGFARNCVAMIADDRLVDLNQTIHSDASIRFLTDKDPESLIILRHSAAHVMAQAVQRIFSGARPTIGPVIEDGFYYDIDMPPISDDIFESIEAEMKKIANAKLPIERIEMGKQAALDFYKNQPYKHELISDLEDGTISLYRQGDFTDLCRGPHVPHTGFVKQFKLLKVSGAYWRADAKNAQLQRLYGTAFFDKKALDDHLHFIEEARRRNHRKIGAAMDLFSFHEEAPGMPFFHAGGMAMWNAILSYWRQEHHAAGYVETKTPVALNRTLWEKSGHWDNYRENMYTLKIDETEYAVKPMNCPGGMLLFGQKPHSYKDLPIRASEIGLVHRHELSGVLNGLFRVRAFHQDDAHIFMTPDQIQPEIIGVLNLMERIYGAFGLSFHIELSTRPEKSIGSDNDWEQATIGLKGALDAYGHPYKLNPGDGAFYGPKIDIHIKDALGRTWQCGTIQLDMMMPDRFDLNYISQNNEKCRPVMIHRVIYGSIERFLGILIEHYAGIFPLWLAPVQIIMLSMNDDLNPHVLTLKKELETLGFRAAVDIRSESLKKKVRDAQLGKIPLIITIGEKEKNAETFAVRTLDGAVRHNVPKKAFLEWMGENIRRRSAELDLNMTP